MLITLWNFPPSPLDMSCTLDVLCFVDQGTDRVTRVARQALTSP